MFKQIITYEDYNGNTREETAFFNLNDVEFARLEANYPGGFSKAVEKVVNSQDPADGFNLFETIVKASYGMKSEDGKRIIKSAEATEAFMQSEAYNELFCGFVQSTETAEKFLNGVIGAKHLQQIAEKK